MSSQYYTVLFQTMGFNYTQLLFGIYSHNQNSNFLLRFDQRVVNTILFLKTIMAVLQNKAEET